MATNLDCLETFFRIVDNDLDRSNELLFPGNSWKNNYITQYEAARLLIYVNEYLEKHTVRERNSQNQSDVNFSTHDFIEQALKQCLKLQNLQLVRLLPDDKIVFKRFIKHMKICPT